MSSNPRAQVMDDERVWLGSALAEDPTFTAFLTATFPAIVSEYGDATLTLELLLEIRYRLAEKLAVMMPNEQNLNIARSMAGWRNVDDILLVHRQTEEEYCRQPRGLTMPEYEAMKKGRLTVGYLLRQNPTALLGPLLPLNSKHSG